MLSDRPAGLDGLEEQAGPEFAQLILRLLEKQVAARCRSALEVTEALRAIPVSDGSTTSVAAGPPPVHYELLVIGSGPAGQRGAIAAAKLGKRVALIDRLDRLGGASVHTSTLPSKTLREAVLYLTGYQQRSFYGRNYQVKDHIVAADLGSRVTMVIKRDRRSSRIICGAMVSTSSTAWRRSARPTRSRSHSPAARWRFRQSEF